jgi:aspartyl-tRNA synthetase
MATAFRTHHAGELTAADEGREVRVAGWVNSRRDHGGVVFIDLRDGSGIIQVVLNPDDHPAGASAIRSLRSEFCISVAGIVELRAPENVNPDMVTGMIDIRASSLDILSPSDVLPFQLDGRADVEEVRRLQYRYLDLRTPRMAANLRTRSTAIRAMRDVLDERDFLEVETPTLIASTPEGARDLLVPSRLRRGAFYALPQSPQLFKQLLMIGGVERYYQIARCYRDEDFRADRQVEFTQLDLEGSFWGRDDVLETLETIAASVVRATRGVDIELPLPRMTYAEALARYGTDKPDTRFGMEIADLSDAFAKTGFKAFAGVLEAGGVVRGINAGVKEMSRSALDGLSAQAQALGAKGLVWMVVEPDGTLRSPVTKFFSEAEQAGIVSALDAGPGEVLLIAADTASIVSRVLGQLRLDMGQPDGHDDLNFLFVIDFPVFEKTENGLVPAHHPFTAPHDVDEMRSSPETALSHAYDMVLNGSELGSGSVRIHDPAIQRQVFDVLGISEENAERRFGWFLEALRYGTPPHAGFAIGVDRMVSIIQNEPNIREVMPFPKTQTGADPLTGSPTRVEETQLVELGIDVRPEVKAQWDIPPTASATADVVAPDEHV